MKLRYLIALLITTLAMGFGGLWYLENTRQFEVSLAAGEPTSQAYALATALKTVVERQHENITVHVYATRGPLQNARLIEDGSVDFAIVERDSVISSNAHLIAELYNDAYQLVVHSESNISDFSDLGGKSIAVPSVGSSDYDAFVFLASQFNIALEDIVLFPGTDQSNQWLFENDSVDAVFKVRSLRDTAVRALLAEPDAQLVGVPQVDAILLASPLLSKITLPPGTYRRDPPQPARNIETLATKRLLVAHRSTSRTVVNIVTSALFDRRRDLIELAPIAGAITRADADSLFLPVHDWAVEFFERHEPHFFQENAEPIAVLLSVIVVIGSLYVHLNNKSNKRLLDKINSELVELARAARGAETYEEIDQCDSFLGEFFDRVVEESSAGRINSQDFSIFQFAFSATEDAIRDREQQIRRRDDRRRVERGANEFARDGRAP